MAVNDLTQEAAQKLDVADTAEALEQVNTTVLNDGRLLIGSPEFADVLNDLEKPRGS